MVNTYKVEGFEAFKAKVDELSKTGQPIYVMFSGSKDAAGKSWCPDCVAAEPVMEDCLKSAPEGSHYLYVSVGDRTFWKDQGNVFRTHKSTLLKSVPTLIKWGTPERLQEDQCSNKNMVSMMFEED